MDRFDALDAPRRFAYESDSSSEEEDAGPSYRPPKPVRSASVIELEWAEHRASRVFVLVGEAGEAFSEGLSALQKAGKASVDGKQVASICRCQDAIVVLASDDVALDAQTPLAIALLDRLKTERLECIDSYSLQGYLATEDIDEPQPVLRFLQTDNTLQPTANLQLFDVPNLVTGLSAALVSQAVYRRIPALLLLAPSMAAASSLHSSITRPRYRPQGIYDPTEASEEASPLKQLFSAASREDEAALGWNALQWSAKTRASTENAWAWLRDQAKQTTRNEYEGLYL